MKKLFLFLSSFILSFSSFAQQYVPMPTDSAWWRCRTVVQDQGFRSVYDFIYYVNGEDTVVNNTTYKKVMLRVTVSDYVNSAPLPPIVTTATGIPDFCIGGVRESNKVVFSIDWYSNEREFFDFNYEVGDTAIHTINNTDTVMSIDQILIDGNYRKIFNVGYASVNKSYIEGIGTFTYGLFYAPYMGTQVLHCFESTQYYNIASYSPPAFTDSCTYIYPYINPASVKETKQQVLAMYPNPVTDMLNVNTSATGTLKIYNTLGQQIGCYKMTGREQSIDLQGLAPGLHSIVMWDDGNVIITAQKFLKK